MQATRPVPELHAKKTSATADGGRTMKLSRSGTFVDVLNPEGQTITVPASREVRVSVPAQRAMILVPEAGAKR